MHARPIALSCVIGVILARSVTGQTPVHPRLTAAVTALRPESAIRIASSEAPMNGRFLNATSESLVLGTATVERSVPLRAIDTLWTARRATGKGAAVGAVVGGVALAALGSFAVWGLCEGDNGCHSDYPPVVGGSLVLGGVTGAFLGAVIGSFSHRWHRDYP